MYHHSSGVQCIALINHRSIELIQICWRHLLKLTEIISTVIFSLNFHLLIDTCIFWLMFLFDTFILYVTSSFFSNCFILIIKKLDSVVLSAFMIVDLPTDKNVGVFTGSGVFWGFHSEDPWFSVCNLLICVYNISIVYLFM